MKQTYRPKRPILLTVLSQTLIVVNHGPFLFFYVFLRLDGVYAVSSQTHYCCDLLASTPYLHNLVCWFLVKEAVGRAC